jgi:calnexin
MFGPDKCGTDNKFHFITRFKSPVKGTYEEKHAKKSELLDSYYNDGKTHLYTLSELDLKIFLGKLCS